VCVISLEGKPQSWRFQWIPLADGRFEILELRFGLPELKVYFTHYRRLSSKKWPPAVKTNYNQLTRQRFTGEK